MPMELRPQVIFQKFVLIFEFKYILLTMQPRLNLKSRTGSLSVLKLISKVLIIVSALGLIFYFIEKVNFPYPQQEIKKDVTDKIIKLK